MENIITFVTKAKSIKIGIVNKKTFTGINFDDNETRLFYDCAFTIVHHFTDSKKKHTITIQGSIERLYILQNKITELKVQCSTLTILDCSLNMIKKLDVSECKRLKKLYCSENKLTSLNITGCTTLEDLNCSSNQLTSLDVSTNKNMSDLYCHNNKIKELDVSELSLLDMFACSQNKLTKLDVHNNILLQFVSCYENNMGEEELISFFKSLPTSLRSEITCDPCEDSSIAKAKGWEIYN